MQTKSTMKTRKGQCETNHIDADKVHVIYPFVSAALPTITCLCYGRGSVSLDAGLPPILVSELFVAVCFGILCQILKDKHKAGIVSSIMVVIFYCFLPIQFAFNVVSWLLFHSSTPIVLVLIGYFACVASICYAATRERIRLGSATREIDQVRLTSALNAVTLIMLFLNLAPCLLVQVAANRAAASIARQIKTEVGSHSFPAVQSKPDIYYLIFDSFPSSKTLKDVWGIDNSSFIDWLKEKGFYVADHSCSNFDRTNWSMSSSLNMQYSNEWIAMAYDQKFDELLFWNLISDNRCKDLVERLGYTYIKVFGDEVSDFAKPHTWNLGGLFVHNFGIVMLNFTPLRLCGATLEGPMYACTELAPLSCLDQIMQAPSPKFVHIHCNVGHGPWVFDETGLIVVKEQNCSASYLTQLRFAETLVKKAVTKILERPGPRPIIIVQSDHGPWSPDPDFRVFASKRMRILNAYYLPGKNNQGLYRDITPVNSFRVIFNDYFGTKFALLPDRSFCTKDAIVTSGLHDATDIVRY